MSGKSSGNNNSPGSINTLIGPSTRIEGDISCNGVLRVQGDIQGNIACDATPAGALVVDSAGSVTGTVRAPHIAVRGRVTGPLQSSQSIEVHQGGRIAGDIAFKELAIHAGGVIDGMLTPAQGVEADAGAQASPKPDVKSDRMPHKARMAGAAAIAVVAVAAWFGRGFLLPSNSSTEAVALRTDTALREAGSEHAEIKPSEERKAATETPVHTAPAPTPAPAVEEASERAETEGGKVLTVRGANPARPANVFLLVTNEPTVLYRKKRGESGEGSRLAVGDGERVSVSVGSDELIRIAKGTDITIFYQGQKVPRQFIASGSWIAFAAR